MTPHKTNWLKKIPWPFVGSVLVVVVTIILSAIRAVHTIEEHMATQFNSFESRLKALETKFEDSDFRGSFKRIDDKTGDLTARVATLDARVSRMQIAVRELARKQSKQTQDLINDLLTAASKTSDSHTASALLGTTRSLLTVLRDKKSPAAPTYFQRTVASIEQIARRIPELSSPAFPVRVALAEYRSALQVPPANATWITFGRMEHGLVIEQSHHGVFRGGVWDFTNVTGDAIVLKDSSDITFVGSYIKGGSQSLDGIRWENVVFLGTTIKYQGGNLDLRNVQFVNCTFEVSPSVRGQRFLDFAALGMKSLTLG